MPRPFDLQHALDALESAEPARSHGRVVELLGQTLRALIPGAQVGEHVRVLPRGAAPVDAKIVGFRGDEAVLLPLGEVTGVAPDDPVEATGGPLRLRCDAALRGRVLDGLRRPLDGRPAPRGEPWPLLRPPPDPLRRGRVERPLITGVRAIDALLTLGEGQRVGLFAGSGVGKTTLLAQLARQTDADMFVFALIGERGREVRELLDDTLGQDGLERGVVVCATSDAPALLRLQAAFTATAIAEYFRERGGRVLLLMDSLTRFARAAREAGLAAGEPPTRRGYPPSVFAELPRLVERAGMGAAGSGSITAIYTVLVEGGDLEEPIADEVRGLLDGHIVLDRAIAESGRFPAIDVLKSLSRVMPQVTGAEQREAARALRSHLAVYEARRDLVSLGMYTAGSDPRLDAALARIDRIEAFLTQPTSEHSPFQRSLAALRALVGGPG